MQQKRVGLCRCGSGSRYKHCCGKMSDFSPNLLADWPENSRILELVLDADEEGFQAGEEPKTRAFKTVLRVVHRLWPDGGTILVGPEARPEVQEIHRLLDDLYRPSDIGVGSLHTGAIMFRDIFARVDIPVIYGRFAFDFIERSDLNKTQKKWLRSRSADRAMFLDQSMDLVDFAYGLEDLNQTRVTDDECRTLMNLTHFQLEAAAATVTGFCDLRGAIQSSLLGAELALKAGLAANGVNENDRRVRFGHDAIKMAQALSGCWQKLDAA